MLILQTDDFERELARFARLGVRRVWAKDLPDIRATHLHPKDIGGAIVSIDQPTPAGVVALGRARLDAAGRPRRAAARGRRHRRRRRPGGAWPRRWATVLGLSVPTAQGATQRLVLDGGWIDFEAADVRGDGISGYTLAVADRDAVLARARDMGLAVACHAVMLFGTRIELREL